MLTMPKRIDRAAENASEHIEVYNAVISNDLAKLSYIKLTRPRLYESYMNAEQGMIEFLSIWKATTPDIFHLGKNITEMLFYTKFGDKVSDDILQHEIVFPSISTNRLRQGVYISFVEPLCGQNLGVTGAFLSLLKFDETTTAVAKQVKNLHPDCNERFDSVCIFGRWTLRIFFNNNDEQLVFNAPYEPESKISDFISHLANSRIKGEEMHDVQNDLSFKARIIAINALLYWQYEQSEFKKHPNLASVNDKIERTKSKLSRLKSKEKKRKAKTKLGTLNKERRFYDRLYLIESQPMEVKTGVTSSEISDRKKPGRHPVRGFWRRTSKGRKFIKPHWRGEGPTLASKNWVSIYDQELMSK
jgi:hypothetical protein